MHACIVMKKADIVVNQGHILDGRVHFDTDHGNWIVENHGVESVDHI